MFIENLKKVIINLNHFVFFEAVQKCIMNRDSARYVISNVFITGNKKHNIINIKVFSYNL